MNLRKLLANGHLLMPPLAESASPQEILEQMVAPLVKDGIVTSAKNFVQDVLNREADMSTQMIGGIAFPHACSSSVQRLGLICCLLPQPGVCFDPDNDELCRILFLIAIPEATPAAHLPLLSDIANFLSVLGNTERLKSAQDCETALALFPEK
ncbi:MAG: PTS sugar transporter subunit IIA [Victivallales bacterium]|nr:PTS sugar transporter subunit IIA [Victivallales bacterium]